MMPTSKTKLNKERNKANAERQAARDANKNITRGGTRWARRKAMQRDGVKPTTPWVDHVPAWKRVLIEAMK
jgi:hypothetical protein